MELGRFEFGAIVHRRIQGELNVESYFMVKRIKHFTCRGGRRCLVSMFTGIGGVIPSTVLLLMNRKSLQGMMRRGMVSLNLVGSIVFCKVDCGMSRLFRTVSIFLLPSRFRKLPVIKMRTRTTKLPILFSSTVAGRTGLVGRICCLPISREDGSV